MTRTDGFVGPATAAVLLALAILCGRAAAEPVPVLGAEVRAPAVAGQFYPSDSATLARAVGFYLENAVAPVPVRPIAIIAPHAGYIYSGQIAADAFRQAAGHDYDLVALLGTNHTTRDLAGAAMSPAGFFRTPLGDVAVDHETAGRLAAVETGFSFDAAPHEREHSIEVLVPFAQILFPGAKILPMVIGESDEAQYTCLGDTLSRILTGRKALIVASSDLSHYPDCEDALRMDRETAEAIAAMDMERMQAVLQHSTDPAAPGLSTRACGAAPILVAAAAARRLGAVAGHVISYANSGETSIGDRARVVGYAAIAFATEPWSTAVDPFARPSPVPPASFALSNDQKHALLAFARKTIAGFLTAEAIPLPRGFDPVLAAPAGAFVTLNEHGRLRGCIGHLSADLPLCQVVGNCTLQAAFNDSRFPPVGLEELPLLEVEISVLTPMQQVRSHTDIQVGRDGVVITKNGRSAVFLPQVATEQGWTRDEMLEHLCAKAGLPPESWKEGAEFSVFQATVFSETDRR